mmetsp:Transcript_108694/g.307409  ORF Transcript_108694/g.307409 Transcript_108694/m.307409 type:complete len:229 (+) Transcript_108694:45-731(+)
MAGSRSPRATYHPPQTAWHLLAPTPAAVRALARSQHGLAPRRQAAAFEEAVPAQEAREVVDLEGRDAADEHDLQQLERQHVGVQRLGDADEPGLEGPLVVVLHADGRDALQHLLDVGLLVEQYRQSRNLRWVDQLTEALPQHIKRDLPFHLFPVKREPLLRYTLHADAVRPVHLCCVADHTFVLVMLQGMLLHDLAKRVLHQDLAVGLRALGAVPLEDLLVVHRVRHF